MTKTCNECNLEKELELFSPLKKGKYGRRAKCKTCQAKIARLSRAENPAASRTAIQKYRKSHPEVIARRDAKYYIKNKERLNEKTKTWRTDNPEKYAELNRRKERVRRARKFDNGSLPYSEQQVLELHGALCHLCKTEIDLTAPRSPGVDGWENGLHIDHVLPLSKGGADILDNVRPAHGLCNLQKWAN